MRLGRSLPFRISIFPGTFFWIRKVVLLRVCVCSCWSWPGSGNQFICRPGRALVFGRGGGCMFSALPRSQHNFSCSGRGQEEGQGPPPGETLDSSLHPFSPVKESSQEVFVTYKPLPASGRPVGLVKPRAWPHCL